MQSFTLDDVARCMSQYAPLYFWRKPTYQYVALANLRRSFSATHRSALDVGGGTGLLANTIKSLFGLERVASVDVEDRFFPSLDIETSVFDGEALPFPDASFDCIILFNVLHHVPVARRIPLLRECRRVAGDGPLYIKDHVSTGVLDDARLAMLDLIGNVPFHGMVSARYLREADWRALARDSGYECEERRLDVYRHGLERAIFPNRLEASFKWRAI